MTEQEIIKELQSRWVPREELSNMLGLPDRAARGYLEELSRKLEAFGMCILSTAAKKGYHIPDPTSEEDVRIAGTAVNELKSKAISIFERRKSIENFLSKASRGAEQLTLF